MPVSLDATFAALSDPTRRGILARLAERELSVGELADAFPITQSAVSRHLQVLEHAGLVSRRREGQRRVCRLEAEPFREAREWIDRYRAFWEGRLERLDRVLKDRGRSARS